jgi:hypothetical protein
MSFLQAASAVVGGHPSGQLFSFVLLRGHDVMRNSRILTLAALEIIISVQQRDFGYHFLLLNASTSSASRNAPQLA